MKMRGTSFNALNILANAVDAAPPGSAIKVRLQGGPTLTIADSGGGIADSQLAHLFEPFYTTKPADT